MAWERKFLSLICKNIFFQLQLLLLMGCSLSDIAISDSNLVKFLPGFQGPLPFQLETGYVGVGEAEEVQIFYYFVESQRDPETDPLVLWLTGGPGCSGFSSLVFELGPMKYDKYNMDNESLPTLLINTNSLTKVTNMIFVDSPIGTGFSYATNSLAYQTGDTKQVNFLYHFLHKWLIDHPKFISNPVYIGGDSYSGITVPMLSLHIAKGNEEGLPYINLQGYLLGNPVTNPSRTINFQIPYVHGMGLISDELYKAFEKNCGGEYAIVDPSNIDCLKNFEVYEECTSRIGSEHILEPLCTSASLKSQHIKIRSLTDQVLHGSCIWDYQNTFSGNWVNSPSVRKALHVREIVDFHGEMVLLENYSALNYTGLVKILKKYDKRTGDLIRLPFIQKVLQQPFYTTDLLYKLVKECERMLDQLFPIKEQKAPTELTDGDDGYDTPTSTTTKNEGILRVPKELAEIEYMKSLYMKSTIMALRVLKEIRSGSSTVSAFSLPPLQISGLEDTWKKVPILEQVAK